MHRAVVYKVNDVNVTELPIERAVRQLTLAEWPRNIHFLVPAREVRSTVWLRTHVSCAPTHTAAFWGPVLGVLARGSLAPFPPFGLSHRRYSLRRSVYFTRVASALPTALRHQVVEEDDMAALFDPSALGAEAADLGIVFESGEMDDADLAAVRLPLQRDPIRVALVVCARLSQGKYLPR